MTGSAAAISRLRSRAGGVTTASSDDRREDATRDRAERRGDDLADEVERARTPRTPALALTGVWLTVAGAVAVVLAIIVLTLYLV